MLYINKLSSAAYQRSFLTGNPGQRVILTVRYLPSQQMWAMDVETDAFQLYGALITNGPNMLRNYRNLIPFGLLCTTDDGQDPYGLEDFETRYARLFLLNRDEVQQVEIDLFS